MIWLELLFKCVLGLVLAAIIWRGLEPDDDDFAG